MSVKRQTRADAAKLGAIARWGLSPRPATCSIRVHARARDLLASTHGDPVANATQAILDGIAANIQCLARPGYGQREATATIRVTTATRDAINTHCDAHGHDRVYFASEAIYKRFAG